jgi:hypothetical protein
LKEFFLSLRLKHTIQTMITIGLFSYKNLSVFLLEFMCFVFFTAFKIALINVSKLQLFPCWTNLRLFELTQSILVQENSSWSNFVWPPGHLPKILLETRQNWVFVYIWRFKLFWVKIFETTAISTFKVHLVVGHWRLQSACSIHQSIWRKIHKKNYNFNVNKEFDSQSFPNKTVIFLVTVWAQFIRLIQHGQEKLLISTNFAIKDNKVQICTNSLLNSTSICKTLNDLKQKQSLTWEVEIKKQS